MTISKSFYVCTALMAIFFVLAYNNTAVTYPDGPPNNRCGLYGTQPTCTACHTANAGATNSLSITSSPTVYTLGQTYSLTISATGGSIYGFEIAAVQATGGANAGTFATPTGTEIANSTVLGNSIAFLKHSTPSNSGAWTINWTAPNTNVGNVTFYLATLSANHNNSTSGDKLQTRTLTLSAPNDCPTLTVNITGDNSICQGQSTTFTANGGNSYVWSNGSGSSSTTVNTAGTYTVTATDANACTGTASVALAVLPKPVATTSGTNALCNGGFGTISLNVTGGNSPYLYAWSNGQTTQNPSNANADTYTLTVTGSNGCSTIATQTITEPPILVVSATGTNATCNGTTVTTTLNVTGGTPTYTYLWSNGQTTPNVTVGAGTYSITCTDTNGCSVIASATIAEPPALFVSTTDNTNTCNGTAIGNATVEVLGGTTPYTYLWSTDATTPNISNLAAGTYTLTVTDANNCTATTNALINSVAAPSPSISQSGSTCVNGVGIYGVDNPGISGTQYNWAVTGGTITTGQGTANITVQWGDGGAGTVHVDQTNP